jgi:hypothetical protein
MAYAHSCWIPKATNTHSQHVILIELSPQQWLHEGSSTLRLYLRCLSCLFYKSNNTGKTTYHGGFFNILILVATSNRTQEKRTFSLLLANVNRGFNFILSENRKKIYGVCTICLFTRDCASLLQKLIRLSVLDEAMTCVKLGPEQQHKYFYSTCIDHFTGNCIIQSPLLERQQLVRCDKRV